MATERDARGSLRLGGACLADLARDARIGTPSYVYDVDAMAREARALREAFEGARHLVAYAVKANSAGPILRTFAAEGCGADVVSGGELLAALGSGVVPEKIVYSGVAKTDDEIDCAIRAGARGILALQVESVEEIDRIAARGRGCDRVARIAIRVNPGLDKESVGTHAHVTTGHDEAKFGVAREEIPAALALARSKHVELVGISAHVGSQLTSTDGYVESARAVFDVALAARRAGASLLFVGTGGGFGIDYGEGCAVTPADFVRAARAEQRAAGLADLPLHVEPGRALVAAHGVLLARVIQTKIARERAWLVIDAGMNDLLRPALYQARHRVVGLEAPGGALRSYRVVGPVCESSDDFGEHDGLSASGFVALLDAGAYGFTMASRYNARALPAEVFLRGGRIAAISPREPVEAWVGGRLGIVGE